MDESNYNQWACCEQEYGIKFVKDQNLMDAYRELISKSLAV